MFGVKKSAALAAVATCVTVCIVPPLVAGPAQAVAQGCVNETTYKVVPIGSAKYEAVGPAAGKHNSAPTTANLSYSITTTTSKSSTMSVGAGVSLGFAIAQVEAKTSYDITTSYSSGITVTDTLPVPGHYYGYDQPKIERRTFEIDQYRQGSGCTVTKKNLGYLYGITAVPFWSSCIATGPCTPKP
jgi:hypothetical protein